MASRVRFAPSPTGRLHVGNARVALVNWLFIHREGGAFLLRIDDTDRERSTREYEDSILEDMRWLGLTWDEMARQSERSARYDEAAQRLRAAGRLYPCYETPEELEYARRRRLARGLPPVYDRAGLHQSAGERARFEAEGRKPHWRFLLEEKDVRWDDLVRGPCHYATGNLSDPVLIRADGTYLYTLPSVVDDAELGVTHVIRGEDHVTNTAAQIQLFLAIGAEPPSFAHLSLLTDRSGQGLSKRLGSLSLGALRDQDIEAMAINSLLAKLGTSDPVLPRQSLDELVAEFSFARFGRATPKFDTAELTHLNARLLREMPFSRAKDRLEALGPGAGETFWNAVRGNLSHLSEAEDWWRICHGDVVPIVEDAAYLARARDLLPPEPWDDETWKSWTGALAGLTGRKGRNLFHPLRLALTGRETGPEMKSLLPLIGRGRAAARLGNEPV